MTASVSSIARPQLSIGVYLESSDLIRSIEEILVHGDRYTLSIAPSEADFFQLIEHQKQQLDCLILQDGKELEALLNRLRTAAILLPIVIFHADQRQLDLRFLYHTAELWVPFNELNQIETWIDRSIEEFLELSPVCQLPDTITPPDFTQDLIAQNFLMLQQRRLTDKLKERLGYLGIYYKRSPKAFLKNLPPQEQQEFLDELRVEYRLIILNYFQDDGDLNQQIDNFVNAAFFADVPVSQIVEIHMELMDEFAKQLKLEGRSEEILLDYRLTLIDTIAHLCEMYRRSIPRES
ncbi:circadian clock protein KaiA [Leptolyngbya sp. NIES-2104]|uniref:circadian clock protein KaiA n=1 Tax=Leptolyngbya sp. NIES-2104 TaxID=1552121 RepID=UPI0006ECAD02|nr:circadian clock protein KaiA [Leptolyngbya sp. NIES-2104]GAP98076.1 circadian clock protein KaiA [Leptolyngbya sp. NIES-2104]